jgi:alpha-L-arabinofuranosidase
VKQILLSLIVICAFSIQAQPRLNIDLNKKGVAISSTQYGLFFEDINHAADGGLYAELIRNRSFEDNLKAPDYWPTFKQSGAVIFTALDSVNLLNSVQRKCLKITTISANTTIRAGVYNTGFWGINLVAGTPYTITFFAKCDTTMKGKLLVSLENALATKLAQSNISLTTEWQKYTVTLTPTTSTANARFVLSANSTGTMWFDMVSMFPPTFNNRTNGLRKDLAQMLVETKPKFLRFPGGCFVEGDVLANRFQWKNTIGPIEERPGHQNLWGYKTTDGLGFYEYLLLCEDLGAEPLYVVNVGLAHNDYQNKNDLSAYIQDALDALEYANGAVTTTYGAKRAAAGHPAPFNIKYLEIGNENYFGNSYGERYNQFYTAIKAKYPTMQCIGNVAAWGTDTPSWTFSYPTQLIDEHYYRSPSWFVNQYKKYDTYSRTGPKVYVGEYAVTSECGQGNMAAAVSEAAYMCGIEKNSDIVPMCSYAPIFVNVNDRQWNPDMICYDAANAYGTPSYYVQKLYANNLGTVNVTFTDSLNTRKAPVTGAVGVGTWATQADFSMVSVKKTDGTVVFADSLATSSTNWTPGTGTWVIANNVYSQSSTATNCRSIAKSISDSVYTYSLKARKTSGNEGFLIIFGCKDANNYYWWNIGGWGNTQHAIERCVNGSKTTLTQTSGSISNNVWYDIRVEVSRTKINCYLNNTLIHSLDIPEDQLLFTSATVDETANVLYLKVVNPQSSDIRTSFGIKNMAAKKISGEWIQLSSPNGTDENSLASPNAIVPVSSSIDTTATILVKTLKGNSVNIFKIKTTDPSALPVVTKKSFSISPNPAKGSVRVYSSESSNFQIEISNLNGQLMKRITTSNGGKVDLSGLSSGTYLISKLNNKEKESRKLVIQ